MRIVYSSLALGLLPFQFGAITSSIFGIRATATACDDGCGIGPPPDSKTGGIFEIGATFDPACKPSINGGNAFIWGSTAANGIAITGSCTGSVSAFAITVPEPSVFRLPRHSEVVGGHKEDQI
ncbi:MAG TPA: hypothetical protein VKB88_19660 [Bryobacteraceae bacterium]|nr:hypothetical protein [Bryobacteraceae bacterium]